MKVKEITLRIRVPEEIEDFNNFEEWCFEELKKIGSKITIHWCEEIEKEALIAREKGLRKERKQSRYLQTRFGDIQISRWKVSNQKEDKKGRNYFYILDKQIGLEKKTGAAKGLKKIPWMFWLTICQAISIRQKKILKIPKHTLKKQSILILNGRRLTLTWEGFIFQWGKNTRLYQCLNKPLI